MIPAPHLLIPENHFTLFFYSIKDQNHPMKARVKSLFAMSKPTVLRTLLLSILFMATFIATLFLLINSPA
jgi:hypothetical protein